MKKLISFSTLLLTLLDVPDTLSQSRITFNDQQLFLNGANFAWIDFARDLGPGTTNFTRFESIFQDVRAHGGNTMRLWLHTTGTVSPQFDATGKVIGPGHNTIEDLVQILDMAWENQVGIMPCLWSFDMLRISNGTTITDRAMSMLSDTSFTHAYINNSLIPMVEALKGHPAIIAWEIFNEPEGMSIEFGWNFNRHVPMSSIQRFVNLCAGAIHRIDPKAQVTNGSWSFLALTDVAAASLSKSNAEAAQLSEAHKNSIERQFELKYGAYLTAEEIVQHTQQSAVLGFNYYSDIRLMAAGGDAKGTLDFYSVHYWNWMHEAISTFHHSASHWNLDKPIVVGEFGMIEPFSPSNVPTEDRFEKLFANGYAGALAWSWTDVNLSTPAQMLAGMLEIRTKYPQEVTIKFRAGTITSFVANPVRMEKGKTSLLFWTTSPGSTVTLNGEPVNENGELEVSPDTTTTFVLIAAGDVTDTSKVTITVLGPLEVNRALARPVVASSGEPNSNVGNPALAVDGNPVTRWSSAWSDNQWIHVDLGQSHSIQRVVLNWDVAYGRSYRIEVSENAQTWTEIYGTTSGDGSIDDLTNLSGSGRYVRMFGQARATPWGFSLWEFQVYGVPLVTGIDDERPQPVTFELKQNYPNPFNPSTKIVYSIPSASQVNLEVFDLLGGKVATLVNSKQPGGAYTVNFSGEGLANGIYFYRLAVGENRQVKRMVLTK